MKQSKYSKRRPANRPAFRQRDMDVYSSARADRIATVKPKPIKHLDHYEQGVFIDDERSLEDCEYLLPECDEWVILRSYVEVREWLYRPKEKKESMFVSFDHYLSRNPAAPDGNDCLEAFMGVREDLAVLMDIQGHSSDGSRNLEKRRRWYGTVEML